MKIRKRVVMLIVWVSFAGFSGAPSRAAEVSSAPEEAPSAAQRVVISVGEWLEEVEVQASRLVQAAEGKYPLIYEGEHRFYGELLRVPDFEPHKESLTEALKRLEAEGGAPERITEGVEAPVYLSGEKGIAKRLEEKGAELAKKSQEWDGLYEKAGRAMEALEKASSVDKEQFIGLSDVLAQLPAVEESFAERYGRLAAKADEEAKSTVVVKDEAEKAVKAALKALRKAYEDRKKHGFMKAVSDDFIPSRKDLANALDGDFDTFTNIEIGIRVEAVLFEGDKLVLRTRWDKRQTRKSSGSDELSDGRTDFVFVKEDADWMLHEMRGSVLYGVTSAAVSEGMGN